MFLTSYLMSKAVQGGAEQSYEKEESVKHDMIRDENKHEETRDVEFKDDLSLHFDATNERFNKTRNNFIQGEKISKHNLGGRKNNQTIDESAATPTFVFVVPNNVLQVNEEIDMSGDGKEQDTNCHNKDDTDEQAVSQNDEHSIETGFKNGNTGDIEEYSTENVSKLANTQHFLGECFAVNGVCEKQSKEKGKWKKDVVMEKFLFQMWRSTKVL